MIFTDLFENTNQTQGVAEDQLDEGMFSNIEQLVDRFYQENNIEPSKQKLEITSPGTRVWTRFDGARHRDPGRILSKYPQLMTGFWEWFKTQPGVRPIGSVRGAYLSSDYDEAVGYKGAYFAMTKDGHMVYGSMKRVSNPKSVWLQKSDEGVAEGHADQQKKIIKRNGQPVGEIGIDRESSPGVGQYYMKHYASDTDNSGYDSREEALGDLKYIMKQSVYGELQGQGVSEAMKPSDIPPSMRDRLTMRDIEAERPQGAFRFRVTFPDGATADFMDFEAAQERATADRGRITRISEEKKNSSARIERILKMLRARHPQAENDLEALIFDFRSQQSQDRSDIARLDAENDAEEADIERLERMLDLIRRRRGAAASEPAMATESLRDDEYHVATVTLDDGTKKKVRITTDEGFRDRITQHFKKQGRQVTDIDVDYAVRSNFSEETPRFVGAPARPKPQPIGPTKVLPPAPGRPGFVNKPVQETKKKPQPTNPELWSRAKAAARSKFDVWPSAYASAWAAKYYKSKGGGWRMGKAKKKD